MTFQKDLLIIIILTAASATMATLSFAPFEYPLLAWFSLWPIFYCCRRYSHNLWWLMFVGFTLSLFVSVFAFHWMIPTFELALRTELLMSLLLFLLFILSMSLKGILLAVAIGLLIKYAKDNSSLNNWYVVGFIGVFVEWVTPQFIPWTWGNIIASNLYLAQILEFTGVYGLSFLLFAGSYYLYELFVVRKVNSSQLNLLAVPALFCICLIFGVIRVSEIETIQSELPTSRVASLQTNSPLAQVEKQYEIRDDVFKVIGETIPNLAKKSFEGAGGSLDLIILPEAVVPFSSTDGNLHNRNWGLYSEPFDLAIRKAARDYNTDIYLGEITVRSGSDYLGNTHGQPTNSSVIYHNDGSRGRSYAKNILFPMGEYIPFVGIADSLGLLALLPPGFAQSQFYAAKSHNLLPYSKSDSNAVFMPLICYEILFSDYVREFYNVGGSELPDYLVNITQDGWFQDSLASAQHLELARLRSIETRRALIRTANSGISVLYGLDGSPVEPIHGPTFTAQFEEAVQVWDVPINKNQTTFFMMYGNSWIGLLGILVLLPFALRLLNARKVTGLIPSANEF